MQLLWRVSVAACMAMLDLHEVHPCQMVLGSGGRVSTQLGVVSC